jgi:transposase InsO family protein
VAFFTNIIHRFGIPNSIITDNGTQFTGKKFLDFCEGHHICVDWAVVAHPMTNGQVERANGMILQGLKLRIYNDLNKFGKWWIKELPSVVWSLRTTPSRATGFSPFFLVYGAEAVLPTDLEYGSPTTKAYDDRSNQTSQEDSLDQLEEAQGRSLNTLGAVSAVSATLPRPKDSAPRLPSGRFGASATTRRPRALQAYSSLGRAVHHRQNFEAWDIQAGQRSRQDLQQCLEHRTATSLLPLKCFKSFMYLDPFTCINKKSNRQGRIGLASAKTEPPSGARRGEPPLHQNFPRKSFQPKRLSSLSLYR